VSLAAFLVVELLSILAICKERPRFLGVIGIILGVTPFPFGSFLLHFAAKSMGFELAP
jgi:hypothetical protein